MTGLSTLGPLLAGISMIVLAGRQFIKAWQVWRKAAARRVWPTTTGTIIDSQIVHNAPFDDPDYSHAYTPRITFQHTVNGITYTNPEFTDRAPNLESKVRALVERYPVGKPVKVYYAPRDPRYAFLAEAIRPPITGTILVGIVELIAGAVLVIVIAAQAL
ncbi:MAG: DUF3592 domain-containing protein [Anaerolineae bacterium]|nr:DUF3592 domain-containing protein [Anaerolineae bacterium]